jgi:hypothetical protein
MVLLAVTSTQAPDPRSTPEYGRGCGGRSSKLETYGWAGEISSGGWLDPETGAGRAPPPSAMPGTPLSASDTPGPLEAVCGGAMGGGRTPVCAAVGSPAKSLARSERWPLVVGFSAASLQIDNVKGSINCSEFKVGVLGL